MRHPETRRLTPDEQAVYDEWLWLLVQWGTHTVDEAHELALRRATPGNTGDAEAFASESESSPDHYALRPPR